MGVEPGNHKNFYFMTVTSFVAHWNPATTESLISFKYWTPLVQSINKFGPKPSGPKHQIFLASEISYSYLSQR